MLAWNQIQMIEYTKFGYSSLEKLSKKIQRQLKFMKINKQK